MSRLAAAPISQAATTTEVRRRAAEPGARPVEAPTDGEADPLRTPSIVQAMRVSDRAAGEAAVGSVHDGPARLTIGTTPEPRIAAAITQCRSAAERRPSAAAAISPAASTTDIFAVVMMSAIIAGSPCAL